VDDSVWCRYHQKITCYVLSHAVACGIPAVKISLLSLLQGISTPLKARTLLPLLRQLADTEAVDDLKRTFADRLDDYVTLVLDVLDASVVADLDDPSTGIWDVYVKLIETYCRDGAYYSPMLHRRSSMVRRDFFESSEQAVAKPALGYHS